MRSRHRLTTSLLAVLVVLAVAGCARRDQAPATEESMTLEELDALSDTTGLSRGPERFRRLEVVRGADGAVRVSGAVELPDGTVGQLVVYASGVAAPLTRIPFKLAGGRFENVVVQAPGGPLAPGSYAVEVTVLLDPAVQPEAVMRALGDPARLRGPGITRGRLGAAAFSRREEFRL